MLKTPTIFKTGPRKKGPYIKYRPEEFGLEKDEKFQPAKPFFRNLQCKFCFRILYFAWGSLCVFPDIFLRAELPGAIMDTLSIGNYLRGLSPQKKNWILEGRE